MTAGEKIAEATGYLRLLKRTSIENIPFVRGLLSAFLTAASSVPDHLLDDYSEVYSLGFTLNDYLDAKKFEEKARDQGKEEAIDFIKWWGQAKNKIQDHPIGSLLSRKRNINVHRKQVPVEFTVRVYDRDRMTTRFSSKLHVDYTDKKGKAHAYERPLVPEVQVPTGMTASADLHFQDLSNINAVTACERYLDLIKNMVEEAHCIF